MASTIITAIGAAAAFLIIYLIGKIWWIALLAAVAVSAVLQWAFSENRKTKTLDFGTGYNIAEGIALGRRQLGDLYEINCRLEGDPINHSLELVITHCKDIFESIEKTNSGHDILQTLTDTFLPMLGKIIKKYKETRQYQLNSAEAKEFQKETIEFVSDFAKRSKQLLQEVHSSSIMEASVDRETLESLMQLRGLDILQMPMENMKEAEDEKQ